VMLLESLSTLAVCNCVCRVLTGCISTTVVHVAMQRRWCSNRADRRRDLAVPGRCAVSSSIIQTSFVPTQHDIQPAITHAQRRTCSSVLPDHAQGMKLCMSKAHL
jgi:hypothetical protein